jgi:DNA-binding NtrC family response regulator
MVDYAMPGINGVALIDAAGACRPGIKAILITGHPEALLSAGSFGHPMLSKPFKPVDLSRRIAELLEDGCSGANNPDELQDNPGANRSG